MACGARRDGRTTLLRGRPVGLPGTAERRLRRTARIPAVPNAVTGRPAVACGWRRLSEPPEQTRTRRPSAKRIRAHYLELQPRMHEALRLGHDPLFVRHEMEVALTDEVVERLRLPGLTRLMAHKPVECDDSPGPEEGRNAGVEAAD